MENLGKDPRLSAFTDRFPDDIILTTQWGIPKGGDANEQTLS